VVRILTIYRLLNPGSECGYIVIGSPLQFGGPAEVDARAVQDDTLYRALDLLLEHKEALFGHLRQRWCDLFGATYRFCSTT